MIRNTSTKQGLKSILSNDSQGDVMHQMGFQGAFDMEFTREKTSLHRTKPKIGYQRSQKLSERTRA
jgi:hypothetical protein